MDKKDEIIDCCIDALTKAEALEITVGELKQEITDPTFTSKRRNDS